jgi:hypothetical protein
MEPAAAQPVDRAYSATPMTALDRRRHRRFPVALLGRFMLSNKREYPCKLVDISVTGIAVNTSVDVGLGERIVAYFDHLGGLEGRVSRIFHGGFGVELIATDHKREKLASQIEWLAKRHELGDTQYRRHERISLGAKTTTLKLDEDISIQVNVIDVSMSGASVQTEARPKIGSEVMVGKLRAKVVRHHPEGLGLEFIDIQNPDAVRRYFG